MRSRPSRADWPRRSRRPTGTTSKRSFGARTWTSGPISPTRKRTTSSSRTSRAEGDEIGDVLSELGFSGIGTGGGCEAYYLSLTDDDDEGPHFLITDYDCGLPGTWREEVLLGYYDSFGSPEGDPVHFDSMRELVDALKKGTAHPQLGKSAQPVKEATFVQADLELVNRHRSSLGMGPIDPAAGWTAGEISDMARSIRETGRMANPSVLPLIEIPKRR